MASSARGASLRFPRFDTAIAARSLGDCDQLPGVDPPSLTTRSHWFPSPVPLTAAHPHVLRCHSRPSLTGARRLTTHSPQGPRLECAPTRSPALSRAEGLTLAFTLRTASPSPPRATDASFKLSNSLTLHTLSELENLYIRPFHAQSLRRQQARKEREEETRKKKQAKRQRQVSAASAGEERRHFAPTTAKVVSRVRLPQPTASSSRPAFAATHPEYAQQHDGRPYTPYDVSTLGKTTSELLSPHTGLSPSHSDSIPSLQGTTSSTSSFFAMALQQPHPPEHEHAASPFSARSTAASYGTTLAPASSSTSLHSATATVSPLLEHAASPSSALAPPHPGPDHSSQPSTYPYPLPPRSLAAPTSSSSSQTQAFTSASALLSTPHPPTPAASSSSKRSPLMLGSQASFSALPPVPPLPFDGPPLVGMGLGQGSQGWKGGGLGGGSGGGGSSSPDHTRRSGREREREKARWEEQEERGAGGSGSGFLPARLRAQEQGSGEGSDDELPPADSADDSADLSADLEAGEGEEEGGDGFDPLSQDTVVHDSQSQSQQREGEWSEEEAEGTREGWKVG
ncbi:putative Protein binding protein [Rhodotorula toruloides ATCC 204091]|uniref:Uncharacterized protein n=1 Tax=Rhodotorula toruloides TaxID=5286 RepID=A0A2T0A967_RHOTO|nr:putative Protein binding protein [Rhodotorula toruloides ATCC 204091]PRQ74552.1 hypothetical protein AAT19DRAFT_14905 [Rhodotorula toruloides]